MAEKVWILKMSAANTQLAIAEADLERAKAAVKVAEMKIQHLKAPSNGKSSSDVRRLGLRRVDASTYEEGGRKVLSTSPSLGSQSPDLCDSPAMTTKSFTKTILSSFKLRKPAATSPEVGALSVMGRIERKEQTAHLEHREPRRRSSFDENMTPVSFQQMPVRAHRPSRKASIDSVVNGGDSKVPHRGFIAQERNNHFNHESKALARKLSGEGRERVEGVGRPVRRLSAQEQLDQLGGKPTSEGPPPSLCFVQ